MFLFHVADILTYAEPVLWTAILIAFLRSDNRRYFPALTYFLTLRVVSTPLLTFFLHAHRLWPAYDQTFYMFYFFIYWTSYLAGIVAIFFVIQQMFQYALAPLPGLSHLGLLAFRWASLASVVAAVAATTTALPHHFSIEWLPIGCERLMRCTGVLELCLLAFLALSVHTLGLSFRSRVFGISLSFGIMATMDFLTSVFVKINDPSMTSTINLVSEVVLAGSLVTWLVYMAVPEPVRKPVMVPATSALVRWNEIATALGHGTPQVALAPAGQFFLQDVEKVVDKILAKNSLNIAS